MIVMAGFVAVGNEKYLGSFKATEEVENGQFVTVDYANGTGSLGEGDYFVQNVNTNIPEYGIDDADFAIKKDEYLRLYVAQAGDILVTTKFTGDLEKGDTVKVGADGNVVKGDGGFVVKDATTAFGKDAVSLLKVDVVAEPTP